MGWSAQWRTKGDLMDAVFVLDERGVVRQTFPATMPVLSRLLTQMGDIESWRSGQPVGVDEVEAESWGQLVFARAGTGEVIEVDPELFWHGIYLWFRSRGVDYDTPGLEDSPAPRIVPTLPRSSLMDD